MKVRRKGSWWALLGILVLVAHASLFGVGPVGADFQTLIEASRGVHPELGGQADGGHDVFFERAGTAGRPLAAWSLGMSSWIWTSAGEWTPFALGGLRLENLALLFLIGNLLGRLVRRLLAPWTDRGQASAASNAAFMILLVHPLSISAVASPGARGDLLGAALAILACTAFLEGRQERSFSRVALAMAATVLATQASELGYLIPIWLGLIEYTSSRRNRPGHVRLRAALTTLIVFGACAGVDVLIRMGLGVDPWPQELHSSLAVLSSFQDAMLALLSGLTKLGVLIMPVNGANAGAFGFVCGALLLVAVIQPALHAGQSAPRFWITLLCIWLVLVLLAEAMRATLNVGPNDFSGSAGLFPAVIIMAFGLSVASTAVSGSRRQGLPLIVVFLLCALARSNARGWRAAAKDARDFYTQVSQLVEDSGSESRYFVIDAPGLTDLFSATPEDLGWVLDRAITGRELRAEEFELARVSEEALLDFARLEEFDQVRGEGLVIVFPNRLVDPGGRRVWVSEGLSSPESAGRVLEWRNPIGEAGGEHSLSAGGHWLGSDGDRPFFADSAGIELISVRDRNPAGASAEAAPQAEIYWRARGGVVQGGKLKGIWVSDGQDRQALFDTGGSLPWLLGPRVDSLLLMGELAETVGAEVWRKPPETAELLEPEIDEDDWHLGRPSGLALEDSTLVEEWVLTLLDLETLEFTEILCEIDSEGDLRAPDAEEISQALRHAPGSLAWGVERRVDGAVIERSGGRL